MTKYTWFDVSQYTSFLERWGFNEEQINFLIDQRNSYETLKRSTEIEECECCHNTKEVNHFDYDNYERGMWYTMNRSGLFEDDEDNKTGITNWEPNDTRRFITEI